MQLIKSFKSKPGDDGRRGNHTLSLEFTSLLPPRFGILVEY
jgi:hypothetical protein